MGDGRQGVEPNRFAQQIFEICGLRHIDAAQLITYHGSSVASKN
jgi:hypothetical protein